jgi:hypothetical protein
LALVDNKVSEGFQIFEWMVAGCGEKDSIPNTPETLKHMFQGCHQAGALEKALEVLSWMQKGCAKPTDEMLSQVVVCLGTVPGTHMPNCTDLTHAPGKKLHDHAYRTSLTWYSCGTRRCLTSHWMEQQRSCHTRGPAVLQKNMSARFYSLTNFVQPPMMANGPHI